MFQADDAFAEWKALLAVPAAERNASFTRRLAAPDLPGDPEVERDCEDLIDPIVDVKAPLMWR